MIHPLIAIARICVRLFQLIIFSVDPIALQKETIRITPDQTTRLKAIFFKAKANLFPHSEKKKLSSLIIASAPMFSQLKVDQVMRCLATYCGEILLRENHGKYLAAATERMMKEGNGFALQGVISALISLKNFAYLNEVNGIPTDLRKFIDRWHDYSVSKAAGRDLTGILHKTDMVDINSLVEFVRNAELPNYLGFWKKFAVVEFDPKDKLRDECKGRPDLFLSKIEEIATMSRYNMSKDPNSYLFQWFFNHTCMKKFILDSAPKDLYHSNSYREEALYPPYAEFAIAGNIVPLMITIRQTFEISIYENYNKHLIAQGFLASEQGDKDDINNTDLFDESFDFSGEDDYEGNAKPVELDVQDDSGDEEDISKMNEKSEEINSFVSTSVLKILYYVLGAAIRSALGTIRTLVTTLKLGELLEPILDCITNCLCINVDDAKHQNLPYHLVESRQRKIGALILPSCNIFNIIMDLEQYILKPLLGTTKAIASLGSDFITYVKLRVEAEGFYSMVDKLLYNAFEKSKIISLEECVISEFIHTVRLKLFDYYMKAATKDMLKFIMKTLNYNKAESRLSFRAHTLLESIKKGDLELEEK